MHSIKNIPHFPRPVVLSNPTKVQRSSNISSFDRLVKENVGDLSKVLRFLYIYLQTGDMFKVSRSVTSIELYGRRR